jgi:tight adherence protein C
MHLLLAFCVAVIVFCGFLLIDWQLAEKRRREALQLRIAPDGDRQSYEEEAAPTTLDSPPSPLANILASLLRGLGVSVEDSKIKLAGRFITAGITSPDAPIFYLFCQRVGSLVMVIIALLIALRSGEGLDKLLSVMMGIFIGIIGIFGPYLYLQNAIDKRKKLLMKAFPDTLDLLLICVESGLALDAALNRVCTELGRAYPEMTSELNRTRLELALINDRVRALMNLGTRTDLIPIRSLVVALVQSERFGTSLTDTLRVLSEDSRLMRLSDSEAKAARLPVLLTIPLIVFLLPALLMIVLGPAIIGFMSGSASGALK